MRVLVVEDEPGARGALAELLVELGHEARVAATVAEALPQLADCDACLTDLQLPDGEGLDVVRAARELPLPRDVVVLTGHGSVRTAVDAMKAGAFDFLMKPLRAAQLATVLELLASSKDTEAHASAPLGAESRLGLLVGSSPSMKEVFRIVSRIARSDAPVMITGESGTGKEVTASSVHLLSRRRERAFVGVNCGALSPNLVESELFGHERGAFTGADKRRVGYFELARGGTLFLDEVTEMAPELQVKLLRVLESRTFRRVGGNDELDVDVRLVASSNRDLHEAVRSGVLREDLYYRLNVLPIALPPLRDRREDLGELCRHLLGLIDEREGSGMKAIETGAMEELARHDWPGNVRELRNVLHRAYVLSDPPQISCEAVRLTLAGARAPQRGGTVAIPHSEPVAGASSVPGSGEDRELVPVYVGDSLEDAEKRLIAATLRATKGNKRLASETLKVSLKTVYNKIKDYGLEG